MTRAIGTAKPAGRARLRRTREGVELRVPGAIFSRWHPRRVMTGLVWDAMAAVVWLHSGAPRVEVLLLGFGGGTVARQLHALSPETAVTGVEIDPKIAALAARMPGAAACRADVIVGDAYAHAARRRGGFDVVIDDVYAAGAGDVARVRPVDAEWLGLLRRCARTGGLVAANFVTGKGHRKAQSAARRLFAGSFPAVWSVTTPRSQNEVLVGGAGVAGARARRRAGAVLALGRDRELWGEIAVRRLA